jgi:hypothetical protein
MLAAAASAPVKRVVVLGCLVWFVSSVNTACGDLDPVVTPTASGSWRAALNDTSSVTLILTEARDGSLTGSGTVETSGSGSTPFSVPRGQHDHPSIWLDFAQPPGPSILWSGEFRSGDEFFVTEELTEQALVFDRQ